MRTIIFLLQKEFIQIFRDKSILPVIFVVPIIQLIILVQAATFEMKNIELVFVDEDNSSISRQIIQKFAGSPFFIIKAIDPNNANAKAYLHKGKADAIIHIPGQFEKKLFRENNAKLQLNINAINGATAGLIQAYALGIITSFNSDLIKQRINIIPLQPNKRIDVTYSHWFNPELNYKTFMVPGILVLLVTIIGFLLSGMNIVKEKEIGTIEQINVTPIHKYQFIIGKLFPFWLIALFELAFGLVIGKLLFHIPIVGNIGLVFLVASIYLLVVLGMGLFISTLVSTQQQAMFVSFFFIIIFIMMSGLFTSVDNIPLWAKYINYINPIAYFVKVIRMILLKGSTINEIKAELFSLISLAFAILSLAIWRYRKTI